ncbi:MAG: hypothetical protein JO170_02815 [Verrucomicrobia bacterium]|nr:hypothetical protein [Verrucomicrobiota bacterium]
MKLVDRKTTQYKARDDRLVRSRLRVPASHFTESLFVRVLSVLICLLLWQTASAHRLNLIVNFQNIPAPTEVAGAFFHLVQSSKLLAHIWSSTARIFVGFGLAAILAVSLGLLVGRIRNSFSNSLRFDSC